MYGSKSVPYNPYKMKGKIMVKELIVCDICKKLVINGPFYTAFVYRKDVKCSRSDGNLIEKRDICDECYQALLETAKKQRENANEHE